MTTVLDELRSRPSISPAQRLRTTTAAVRVSFTWLGVRKTLTAEQKAEAAEPFGAIAHFLSAGKKLIDTAHPAFKAVTANGTVRCIYSEAIDLNSLGSPRICRASHVEPDEHGCWLADLSPVHGPMLGPFRCRSEALIAERAWLEAKWLWTAE